MEPSPAPIAEIHSDRLHLRPLRDDDAEDLHGAFADPANVEWWHRSASPSVEVTRSRLRDDVAGGHLWAIARSGSDRAIGHVGFVGRPAPGEVTGFGYFLARAHWGEGLATAAARLALDHGFSALGVAGAELWIYEGNTASIRVAEKLGATLEGRTTFVNVERGIWPRGRVYLVAASGDARERGPLRATARFRVPDVAASIDWFATRLGWKVDYAVGSPPVAAQVVGPGFPPEVALIRLSLGEPRSTEVAVTVPEGLDALADRAGDAVVEPPTDRPWGMRDFTVADPWGNILVFEGPPRLADTPPDPGPGD